MTKRIHEAGTLSVDQAKGTLRVCLITEGVGSSAEFPRSFFTQKNAEALAGSLSFPAHPYDLEHPEHRDPLSAIGSIGDTVTIEENDGVMGFWGEYKVAESKPDVAAYLKEFGHKLGLSIYQDSDGHTDASTGRWVAESLDAGDAYKSVDLVVAAGRGGKFEKVAEALGLLPKASATAEEKNEDAHMEKIDEVADKVSKLTVVVEALAQTIAAGKTAEAQVEADAAAVNKAVEAKVAAYAASEKLIADAKLTESQSADLRALALTGEDIAPAIEKAKAVLAEALALAKPTNGSEDRYRVTEHRSGNEDKQGEFSAEIAGFGKVS